MVRYFGQGDVYAISTVLPVLATFAVIARVWVRKKKDTLLAADDFTIMLALALTWGLAIILIDGTAYDPTTGQDLPGLNALYDSKLYYIYNVIFIPTIGILKISVVLFYRRIFVTPGFQRLFMTLLVFLAIWTLTFFFARTFACGSHPSAFWTTSAELIRYCGPYQAIELGFGVSDIITDLMVLATPIPSVWQLHMPTSQKIAVTAVFLLGLLSTASGAVRVAFLIIEEYETRPGYRDVIAIGTLTLGWAQVEAGVGIIAACLPTLRPLLLGKAPESLINSIRSALPLSSSGSGRSRRRNLMRKDSGGEGPVETVPAPARAAGPSIGPIAAVDREVRSHVPDTGPRLDQPDDAIELGIVEPSKRRG